MKYGILLFKFFLQIIYFFLKLLPTNKKKVVFISRQANTITLDFQLLKDEIYRLDRNYKVVVLCKKLEKGIGNCVCYIFHMFKQMYHLATSKTCIIDGYCISVSILKHKKELKIIQIWHAIASIKQFGYQTLDKEFGRTKKLASVLNMHKNYDFAISGSKAMQSVFAKTFAMKKNQIKVIGTPRIDYLLKANTNNNEKIIAKYPELAKRQNILYAPTFRKDKDVDYYEMLKTIDFSKYNLIVKNHPVKQEKKQSENIFICEEFSTMDLLFIADYVITDYSAVCIEASLLNKPVYFYLYDYLDYTKKNGLNVDLKKEMNGCCFTSFKALYKKIEENKYPYKKLEKFKNKYVTYQNGKCTYVLANYIVNGVWKKPL